MASKIPKFGAWNAGEDVTYTARFETARKGKPGGPIINPNDILMNQAMLPPPATPPHQTKPKPKQPKFGAWEEEEEVPYTQFFESQVKTNPNEPQMNRDVSHTQHPKAPLPMTNAKEKPKQPTFGAWEEEEEVPYTLYFESQGKTNPNEPQTNRDVGHNQQPKAPKVGSAFKKDDEAHPLEQNGGCGMNSGHPHAKPQGVKFAADEPSVKQSPHHPAIGGRGRGNTPQQKPPAFAGPSPGRGARVPEFGSWNDNPAKAGGYTVVFEQLHQDKKKGTTPNVDVNSTPYRNTPIRPTKQRKQGGCLSWLLG